MFSNSDPIWLVNKTIKLMFDLLKYLSGTGNQEEKYENHWEELIKKNTKQNTILIDWEFVQTDVLIFNCSSHDIKIEYNGINTHIYSYLGCEGEWPRYMSLNLTNEDTIKIMYNNKITDKKVYPKTILYLENKDFIDNN
jgi:hypothetical protein